MCPLCLQGVPEHMHADRLQEMEGEVKRLQVSSSSPVAAEGPLASKNPRDAELGATREGVKKNSAWNFIHQI